MNELPCLNQAVDVFSQLHHSVMQDVGSTNSHSKQKLCTALWIGRSGIKKPRIVTQISDMHFLRLNAINFNQVLFRPGRNRNDLASESYIDPSHCPEPDTTSIHVPWETLRNGVKY